jgi:ubiquitin carboxyl-terminal hydrolase 8
MMNISRYLKKDDKYLELYKTKKGGLKNIGATCYINTLIQCLASSPYFIRFILSNDFQDRLENNKNNEDNKIYLINELKDIINSLCIKGNSLIPIRFLKTLKLKFDFIDINEQNDLHEILLLILNKLNEEIKIHNAKDKFNTKLLDLNLNNNISDYRKIEIQAHKQWYNLHKNEYSELTELFYGQSISQIICGNCSHIHHNHESYNALNLELPTKVNVKQTTLYDCINMHTKKEIIEKGEWKCDKCNIKEKSEKIIKYWNFPPNLIICLKRFYYNEKIKRMSKNNLNIDIPFDLDLKEYAISKNSNTKYKLNAIGLHLGNIYGGHYVAIVRKNPNNDDEWLMIDDLSINTIKKKDLNAGHLGYVLFYSI